MSKYFVFLVLVIAACLVGCTGQAGDYTAASSISKNGFARNGKAARALDGQEVKLWGFVDHSNVYGDDRAKEILGDWWSGEGPDAATWRFNLKAKAGDEAGQSFQILVPNDPGRDELLRVFASDAEAGQPTKVFVTGRLFTFDAPIASRSLTGLSMELQSSYDIRLELPEQE